MNPNEQLNLQVTLPRYFDVFNINFAVINYGVKTNTVEEKVRLLVEQRRKILEIANQSGVLTKRDSDNKDKIDIFPITTLAGRMYGRKSMWGQPHTDVMVSYPGINRITDKEKFLVLEIIDSANRPAIADEKPLIPKNLVFGQRSGVDLTQTGLEAGYLGPLFNHNAKMLPISLNRAFWDDHTHNDLNASLYELALDNETGLIIKPETYWTIKNNFFPQRRIYSRFTDEVALPAPRTLEEA